MLSLTQFIIVKYDVCTCKHKCVGVGICWRLSQWCISSISKKIYMKYFKPAYRMGISCHNHLETSTRGFLAEICCVMQFFLLKQSRGQFGGDSPCSPFSLVSFIIVWLSKPVILTHRKKASQYAALVLPVSVLPPEYLWAHQKVRRTSNPSTGDILLRTGLLERNLLAKTFQLDSEFKMKGGICKTLAF